MILSRVTGLSKTLHTVTWTFPVLRNLSLTSATPYSYEDADRGGVGLLNWPQINAPKLERITLFSRGQFARVVALACSFPRLIEICVQDRSFGDDVDLDLPEPPKQLVHAVQSGLWPGLTRLEFPGLRTVEFLRALVIAPHRPLQTIDFCVHAATPVSLLWSLLTVHPTLLTVNLFVDSIFSSERPANSEDAFECSVEDLNRRLCRTTLELRSLKLDIADDSFFNRLNLSRLEQALRNLRRPRSHIVDRRSAGRLSCSARFVLE